MNLFRGEGIDLGFVDIKSQIIILALSIFLFIFTGISSIKSKRLYNPSGNVPQGDEVVQGKWALIWGWIFIILGILLGIGLIDTLWQRINR